MAKLTVKAVTAMNKPGRYPDGDGLYLQVAPGGSKQWLFRYKVQGRERQMGLGPVGEPPDRVPLAEARKRAADARAKLRERQDPIEARRAAERGREADRRRAAVNTFRIAAEAYIAAREGEWRNDKHRYQWRRTLETCAYPVIGDMAVADVDTTAVLSVLDTIWLTKPETASRLRGRIEAVLDYARARGLREGANPAAWRGHLAHMLARPSKLHRVRHHAALPWKRMGAFMAELRARSALAARALEFAILTAARSGEVLGARWREIDLDAGVWTVPAERMKAGREHRVPLTGAALAVLRALHPLSRGPNSPIFPGQCPRAPLSGMALEMLVRRMNRDEARSMTDKKHCSEGEAAGKPPRWCDRDGRAITPHGFRSTFRDWVGESSRFPPDLAEAALAHTVRDKTVAAYARGDLFEKRRRLMEAWVEWCARPAAEAGKVVKLRTGMRQAVRHDDLRVGT